MGTVYVFSTSGRVTDVAVMRVIGNIHMGNIHATVVNMDTQMNTYNTETAIVRIMLNIHADVAHMDRARNIDTVVATMATVGRIHTVVANILCLRCVHVCQEHFEDGG